MSLRPELGVRPGLVVLVTGTGTEVGKTWVASHLAARLGPRARVAARKPVQSFDPDEVDAGSPTDAEVLARATGEPVDEVCPAHRSYPVAFAPPMAADVLGRPQILLRDLVAELHFPSGVDVGLIEAAGGVRSPVADDGDAVALRDAIHADVTLLVADAGLGTVHAVASSVDALGRDDDVVVVLNRFDAGDDLHRRNREWLTARLGFDVVTSVDALVDRHPHWCRQAAPPNSG